MTKTEQRKVKAWLKVQAKACKNKYFVYKGTSVGCACNLTNEVQITQPFGNYIVSGCGFVLCQEEHRNFIEYSFVFDMVKFFWIIDK